MWYYYELNLIAVTEIGSQPKAANCFNKKRETAVVLTALDHLISIKTTIFEEHQIYFKEKTGIFVEGAFEPILMF